MAFVPQFEQDVFVSYGHLDNQPLLTGNENSRWVSTLKTYLQKFLDIKLGYRAAIWMDVRELQGNEPLQPEIREAVSQSACLLAVLSNSYMASEWCAEERDLFVAVTEQDQAVSGRIFVIHPDEIPRDDWPRAFSDLVGYPFYEKDELTGVTRTLGVPQPQPDDRAYHSRLNRLVTDLAKQLKMLKFPSQDDDVKVDVAEERKTVVSVGEKSTVLLAETTGDLIDVRDEVRMHLTQSGLRVLPEALYSRTVSVYRDSMRRDLEQCGLFVQLLGPFPPVRTEELPQGYVGLQLELARESSTPELRWRRPDLKLPDIKDEAFRRFLNDNVVAVDLVDFERLIIAKLRTISVQRDEPEVAEDRVVLVKADPSDADVADSVAERLSSFQLGYEIRDEEEYSLSELALADRYHGLIVIFGDCSPDWVRQRVRECREVEQTKRHHAPVCAVFIGPPPPPKRLKYRYRNLRVIEHGDQDGLRSYAKAVEEKEFS